MSPERLVPWQALHDGPGARVEPDRPGSNGKCAVQVAQLLARVDRVLQQHRVDGALPALDHAVVDSRGAVRLSRAEQDRRRIQPQFIRHDRRQRAIVVPVRRVGQGEDHDGVGRLRRGASEHLRFAGNEIGRAGKRARP